MPLSRYDRQFGGKKGSARKAKRAMAKQYGAKKGEQVFYAKNKRAGQQHEDSQDERTRLREAFLKHNKKRRRKGRG